MPRWSEATGAPSEPRQRYQGLGGNHHHPQHRQHLSAPTSDVHPHANWMGAGCGMSGAWGETHVAEQQRRYHQEQHNSHPYPGDHVVRAPPGSLAPGYYAAQSGRGRTETSSAQGRWATQPPWPPIGTSPTTWPPQEGMGRWRPRPPTAMAAASAWGNGISVPAVVQQQQQHQTQWGTWANGVAPGPRPPTMSPPMMRLGALHAPAHGGGGGSALVEPPQWQRPSPVRMGFPGAWGGWEEQDWPYYHGFAQPPPPPQASWTATPGAPAYRVPPGSRTMGAAEAPQPMSSALAPAGHVSRGTHRHGFHTSARADGPRSHALGPNRPAVEDAPSARSGQGAPRGTGKREPAPIINIRAEPRAAYLADCEARGGARRWDGGEATPPPTQPLPLLLLDLNGTLLNRQTKGHRGGMGELGASTESTRCRGAAQDASDVAGAQNGGGAGGSRGNVAAKSRRPIRRPFLTAFFRYCLGLEEAAQAQEAEALTRGDGEQDAAAAAASRVRTEPATDSDTSDVGMDEDGRRQSRASPARGSGAAVVVDREKRWARWEARRALRDARKAPFEPLPHGSTFWDPPPRPPSPEADADEVATGGAVPSPSRSRRAYELDPPACWRTHALEPLPPAGARFRLAVWSSARAANVASMVRALLEPAEAALLLRVWSRETLVPRRGYADKVGSLKDLEVAWSALNVTPDEWTRPRGKLLLREPDALGRGAARGARGKVEKGEEEAGGEEEGAERLEEELWRREGIPEGERRLWADYRDAQDVGEKTRHQSPGPGAPRRGERFSPRPSAQPTSSSSASSRSALDAQRFVIVAPPSASATNALRDAGAAKPSPPSSSRTDEGAWPATLARGYGAHNTLLLDDSRAKARMQRHNHVVVGEFDDARAAEVRRLREEREVVREAVQRLRAAGAGSRAGVELEGGERRTSEAEEVDSEQSGREALVAARIERRLKKKQRKKLQALVGDGKADSGYEAQPSNHRGGGQGDDHGDGREASALARAELRCDEIEARIEAVDDVLLQAVGVLSHARCHDHVGRWIASGALGSFGTPSQAHTLSHKVEAGALDSDSERGRGARRHEERGNGSRQWPRRPASPPAESLSPRFETPFRERTPSFWAQEGRNALRRAGIAVEVG